MRSSRRLVSLGLAVAGCLWWTSAALPAPPVVRQGGVAAGEADATAVGAAILAAGGNAVDAAVATALALAVVQPEAGNLAGGGFAVVRLAGGSRFALDFRETAPAAAGATMYLDADGNPRADASTVGPLAAGVPGSPTGYHALHTRLGRLPWAAVVQPAIALARDGFAVSARTARTLAEERDALARFPETAAVWLPDDRPRGAGTRLRLPALAQTLEAYAARGPVAITEGPVAAAIVAASERHGGVLTRADLAGYRPEWREPIVAERFGWTIASMPLPSSGGILLASMLGLLERTGWRDLPIGGVERAHRFGEAARRSYADRFLLGDPASTRAGAGELLAPLWLALRAASIDPRRATASSDVAPYAAGASTEPADTTHVSVIDADGNAVALTTTLNDAFGCRLWVDEVGFLNDQMDDFATAPGRPNLYGLIQGEGNTVAPGRRMLSSMTPTIAWRGDELVALGGRGGSRIPTGVLQVLLHLWDGDAPLAAVARPRLHHQWLPDRLEVEKGALTAADRADLAARGHTLFDPTSTVKVNLVVRRADGSVEAAGDPRGPEIAVATTVPVRGASPLTPTGR